VHDLAPAQQLTLRAIQHDLAEQVSQR
jgi:hypothetical protein